MSDDSTLLIKISADIANVTKAYDDITDQTEDLQDTLTGLAEVSGVAFAGLVATVGLSVDAFADSDTASRQLSESLQNQGIYTDALKQSYLEYAAQISETTGVSKTQIVQAMATAQQFAGQIPLTKELTAAIVDYSVAMKMDLSSAAESVGKAIGNGTGQLLRMGLQVDATATSTQRMSDVLEFLQVKFGGAATAISPVTLATKQLKNAFEESSIQLGQQFAPAIAAAENALASIIKPSQDANGEIGIFREALTVAALAVTGIATAVPVAAGALIVLRAAIKALNVDITATSVLLKGLGIGIAIAVISFAIVELAEHWREAWGAIKAVAKDAGEFVITVMSGIASALEGVVTGNIGEIKAGLAEIGSAFHKVGTDAKAGWQAAADASKQGATVQIQAKKDLADKLAAAGKGKGDNVAIAKAEADALRLVEVGADEDRIQLKKKEIEELKALDDQKNKAQFAQLQKNLAQTQAQEQVAAGKEFEQRNELNEEILSADKDFGGRISEQNKQLSQKEQQDLRKSALNEATAEKKVYQDDLKQRITAHNTFLEEQVKYGNAYAAINQLIHSKEVQGLETSFSDLAQLTQSKNNTLKAIGKVASIANITIKTAESAMNIYAGFSAIPIIGPALGIAGAAAAVAFGAEQIGDVTAAASGALVGGTGYGDSQPYMLEPGELVAPRQNFNEVVNSVAASRQQAQNGAPGQNGSAQVAFSLSPDLMDFVEANLVQRKALNISLLGSK